MYSQSKFMDITYLGHSSFRLKGKTATLITDPFDPQMVGLSYPKVEADIVTVSHEHADHNKVELVKNVSKVISGPGEYEIKGVSIIGIASFHDNKKGAIRGGNTIYIIEMDKLRLVHLGDLGHKLSDDIFSDFGEIDVLIVPVGGEYTITSSDAVEVVQDIEPEIVIPMHYKLPGMDEKTFGKLSGVDEFINQVGLAVEKSDKLSLKKENLFGDQKVVVLERKG